MTEDGWFGLFIVAAIFTNFVLGFMTSWIFERKGYSAGHGFFVGLLFGIFGLIAAAGAPDLKLQRAMEALAGTGAGGGPLGEENTTPHPETPAGSPDASADPSDR